MGATPIPATVPGEVDADLLAADLIPDPFDGDNEDRLHWIGSTDWSYRTTFAFERGDAPAARPRLRRPRHRGHRAAERHGDRAGRPTSTGRTGSTSPSALRDGDNDLEVRFEGPVSAAQRLSAELGDRPQAYAHPFNAIRKMAAGYGWDWGPDLAGVGIWRSVGIESWSGVRLGSVRPLALVEGTSGRLETHVELEWADASGDAVEVAVTLGGTDGHRRGRARRRPRSCSS